MKPIQLVLPLALLLAACHPQGGNNADGTISQGGTSGDAFAGIGEQDTLHFTGTEPFWGGSVTGKALTYNTLENPDGTTIQVQRFAGNNGLGFTGTLGSGSFDMAVTQSPCSDGMSDRTYPFVVSLRISGGLQQGCAWTDAKPFKGPETP